MHIKTRKLKKNCERLKKTDSALPKMSSEVSKVKRRRKTIQKLSTAKGERLIDVVRATKGLYDPSQKVYADFEAKAELWKKVAEKCGVKSGLEAKMMWKNLRDCYRICRKKMYYNPNAKTWKFYEKMKFLTPYIKDRKWKYVTEAENAKAKEAAESAKRTEETSPDDCSITVVNNPMEISEEDQEFTTVQYWNDNEVRTAEVEPRTTATQRSSSTRESARPESPIDSDEVSFEDVLPEALNNGSVDQSLKMFFDAMYASVACLPQPLQRRVKNKIFNAVLDGEEEAEKMKKTNPSSATIPRVKAEN